jgi:hypothetical protein
MSKKITFLVIGESATQSRGPNFAVAGRCLDGPILVGDHFRAIQGGEEAEPFDLVVEEISAYGKLLSQLDPVVTGELVLSGELRQPLTSHAVLVGEVR